MAAEALASSPVKPSLLTYMTTFGVDDWLFVANVCSAIVICVVMRIYSWGLIAVGLHFALMLVTKLSPNILEIYVKHTHQAARYSPFPSPLQRRGLRPQGFGRKPV